MAQREARQFNPYGRADYFRIAGDSPGTPRLARPRSIPASVWREPSPNLNMRSQRHPYQALPIPSATLAWDRWRPRAVQAQTPP